MAIEIIRKATPIFTMECEKCECVFTYSVQDLVKYLSAEYVRCPCCGEDIQHYERQRVHETTIKLTSDDVE